MANDLLNTIDKTLIQGGLSVRAKGFKNKKLFPISCHTDFGCSKLNCFDFFIRDKVKDLFFIISKEKGFHKQIENGKFEHKPNINTL